MTMTKQEYLKAVGIPAALPAQYAEDELDEEFYEYINNLLWFTNPERRQELKLDIFKKLQTEEHYCPLCGRLVTADQKIIYTRTKRKTIVFVHDECFRKELNLDD